jgi:hypothetical protein
MDKCINTECYHHESWFAIAMQTKIDDLLVHRDSLILSNIQLATINAEQAEELKALRGFANDVCNHYLWSIGVDAAFELFKRYGLMDDNGNPTSLLTGK